MESFSWAFCPSWQLNYTTNTKNNNNKKIPTPPPPQKKKKTVLSYLSVLVLAEAYLGKSY